MDFFGTGAKKRAEEAEQKAEEAERIAEEAKKIAEEAKRRAIIAEQRAHDAKKKEDLAQDASIKLALMVAEDFDKVKEDLDKNITDDKEQAELITELKAELEKNITYDKEQAELITELKAELEKNIIDDKEQAENIKQLLTTFEVHEQKQQTIFDTHASRLSSLEKLFAEERNNRVAECNSIRDQINTEETKRINAIESESKHRQQAADILNFVIQQIAHNVDHKFENISNILEVFMLLIKNVDNRQSKLEELKTYASKFIAGILNEQPERDSRFKEENKKEENKKDDNQTVSDTIENARNKFVADLINNNKISHDVKKSFMTIEPIEPITPQFESFSGSVTIQNPSLVQETIPNTN
jgi:hypothetical protein